MGSECWLWPYCQSSLPYGGHRMTKIAIRTAWVALFICGVVFAYGHGYKSGKSAQLDFADVLKVAKSQFTCRMEIK